MFLLPDLALVTSASDLTLASKCEFAFLRTLDFKLGWIEGIPENVDPMLARAGELGDQHETRVAEDYKRELGDGVVEIGRPEDKSRGSYRKAAAETEAAFDAKAPVVYQATFFDETDPQAPFIGFADFIALQPDGTYRVLDSKLARSAKVTALLQLAAYHEQLQRLGVPTDDTVELILGDGSSSEHDIADIRPVFLERRARLHAIIREHLAEPGPASWGDARYVVDGRCEHCEPEVVAHRDLLLVAGIRVTQRAKLLDAGIDTIDDLAATPTKPSGCEVPDSTYATLQAQATLQVSASITDDPHAVPPFEFFAPQVIADLPAPDDGDLFFDFEGDPLWRAAGRTTRESLWGIDYLFGMVDTSETFTAFWAHDLAAERRALLDFLEFVALRRAAHPGMHIYHYAAYERTHLLAIAARHGVGEREVDDLLREGVLVDLYPVVKKTTRIGGRSYSIKKLEPLYMGADVRVQDVTTGADSVVQYNLAMDARTEGDGAEAERILNDIGDYNRYDCVSTLRLRDWLIARAGEAGVLPGTTEALPSLAKGFERSPLSGALLKQAGLAIEHGRQADVDGYRLAAAAIDYHQREAKSYWAEHFARLVEAVDSWADVRGVLVAESAEVVEDWAVGDRGHARRVIRMHGAWAPGSGVPRGDVFVLYEQPAPWFRPGMRPGARLAADARIVEDPDGDADATGSVLIEERAPEHIEPWTQLPVAITPGPPPRADSLVKAIEEWGTEVVTAAPGWPADAAADILRRSAPRAGSSGLEHMASADDGVRAVVASLLRLSGSYLAVQGPPGTGKTYLAGHVIARLVQEHQWRVGVVAQSHKVVEHVLEGVVGAGLDPTLVGKAPSSEAGVGGYAELAFTELGRTEHQQFAEEHATTGYVLGGTAWDFTNLRRVARKQLDLLVIDEAGQFSLAATIAVGMSARNLLLLGDPQQLPQVSQGTHPAPVDESALGAIIQGHDVMPEELGYFLAESRRMDAAVTAPVSRLAYEGELRSHACTLERSLVGVPAGLRSIPVHHEGNATSSDEEAAVVVDLVRDHLGARWTDPSVARDDSPLGQADIIVVTPYNAQVEVIRSALDAAGYPAVRVGTVDKFQGQEAVISIVSLAASSAVDVPRGLPFIVSRNRLNVAISRAQWAAYLVHSPRLADALPWTAEGVAELSRFIELVRS